MNTIFEPLDEKHRTDVMDIFNYYAEHSFAAYPETKLPYEFYNMFLDIAKQHPAYAIKQEGSETVIGFCMLRPYNPFPAFSETAEISCFIDKAFTGQGIGRDVLDLLEDDAKKRGVKNILAGITSENKASLTFHRKNGFAECGRFTGVGRKFGKAFDIVWMQKSQY